MTDQINYVPLRFLHLQVLLDLTAICNWDPSKPVIVSFILSSSHSGLKRGKGVAPIVELPPLSFLNWENSLYYCSLRMYIQYTTAQRVTMANFFLLQLIESLRGKKTP